MYEKPGAEWSREQQTKGWSMMNAFLPANILIPQVDSMEKWAVIACDQFTSDPAYWARVAETVGNAPSTLRLILPEAELGTPQEAAHTEQINRTMEAYLQSGLFQTYENAFVYVERTLQNGSVRKGLVGMVDLEDYVKGVLPSEMPGDWELEALKAQAVCARTFACLTTKHLSAYGFDVCSSTDCQAYSGIGEATSATDRAVEETEGECLYYDGELAQAYYHSSDGGATEDAENVWGTDVPYLRGKEDPYEAQISIPDYRWTVTYTWEELTWVLQNSGYDIGDVVDAYVSEVTDLGNVYSVTFVDSRGNTLVRTGDDARMAFYSTTLGKNVPSLRFTITGGTGGGSSYAVNSASGTLSSLDGASVISGSGTVSRLEGEEHSAISSSGTSDLTGGSGSRGSASRDGITVTGTGNGHNVGMSQYGAKAMAEQGHDYIDILEFYFTGIRVR